MPPQEKVVINENVVYVKYKDNTEVFFADFDSSVSSLQEYTAALQQEHLSTVQEIRSKSMSLATYRQFAQIRAVSTLQKVFDEYEITKLERPLDGYTTFDRGTNFYKITTTPEQVGAIVAQIAEDKSVEYVESGKKEYVTYVMPYEDITINDPYINDQRHVW